MPRPPSVARAVARAAGLAALVLCAPTPVVAADPPDGGARGPAPADPAAAVDRAAAEVLKIWVDLGGGDLGVGSGFPVAGGGPVAAGGTLVLTNAHVVAGARRVTVALRRDGRVLQAAARIVATAPERDLALLEVAPGQPGAPALTALALALPPLAGRPATALGYPAEAGNLGGRRSWTDLVADTEAVFRTAGTVNKVEDKRLAAGAPLIPLVFHDARIHSGNSGGPLVDPCGRVIGINTAITREAEFPIAISAVVIAGFLAAAGRPAAFDEAPCPPPGAAAPAALPVAVQPTPPATPPSLPQPASPPAGPDAPAPAAGAAPPSWALGFVLGASLALALAALLVALMRQQPRPSAVGMGALPPSPAPTHAATGAPTRAGTAARAASPPARPRVGAEPPALGLSSGGVSTGISAAALARPDGVVIGRDPALCDLVLDHPGVSRRHARLRRLDGALTIEDLGSGAGLTVDGRPLPPWQARPLTPPARLGLGEVRVEVS